MSMIRTALVSTRRAALVTPARTLHSTPSAPKTVTEKVSEVAEKVNKSVGRGLASAIEKGEHATETTLETLGVSKRKAKEATEMASQKTNQTAAGARERVRDFKDIEDETPRWPPEV